jgi:hypothetical protein
VQTQSAQIDTFFDGPVSDQEKSVQCQNDTVMAALTGKTVKILCNITCIIRETLNIPLYTVFTTSLHNKCMQHVCKNSALYFDFI